VCPYNIKFSEALAPGSPYAAREALGGEDARALARELLGMTQEEFSRAFKGSPMKRAKLRGLKRNAAVVLGNVGSAEDAMLLERVREEEPDEMLRAHAVWALAQLSRALSPATTGASEEFETSPATTSCRLETGTRSP
jgi:epoxyqueuosine reductase QueG